MVNRSLTGTLTLLLAVLLCASAHAATVTDVSVEKAVDREGTNYVKVAVHATGPLQYRVQKLPPGAEDYRSIALDVWPAHIAGSKEPKQALPVNSGLVSQVRVRQYDVRTVRIYVDVLMWPRFRVVREGGQLQIQVDAVHMGPGAQ